MEKIINKFETKGDNLSNKMTSLITVLKSVSLESPCFQNIMEQLFILSKDIDRLEFSIDKIKLDIISDKKDISLETAQDIKDETDFQEMMRHFLPAMLFYTMCKNS